MNIISLKFRKPMRIFENVRFILKSQLSLRGGTFTCDREHPCTDYDHSATIGEFFLNQIVINLFTLKLLNNAKIFLSIIY